MGRVLSFIASCALAALGVVGCGRSESTGADGGLGGAVNGAGGTGATGGTGGVEAAAGTSGGGGGGGAAGTGGVDGTAAEIELCTAICGHDLRCGANFGTMSECLSNCQAKNGPLDALFKPAFLSQSAKCYPDLACDKSDDACISAAVASVTPVGQPDSLSVSCQNRLAECYGEDALAVACEFLPAFNDQGRSRLQACLAKSCVDIRTCINALSKKP